MNSLVFNEMEGYPFDFTRTQGIHPPGVVAQHSHTIEKGSLTPRPNGTAENLGTFSIGNIKD